MRLETAVTHATSPPGGPPRGDTAGSSHVTSGPDHEPLTRERHAAVVDYLCRQVPRVWTSLYRPQRYVYDDRDQAIGDDLDGKCQDLRVAFHYVDQWQEMIRMLHDLRGFDERRRRLSIGVIIDGRVIHGESL